MKLKKGSSATSGPFIQPDNRFFAISLLLIVTLIASEIFSYYDTLRFMAEQARSEARIQSEYIKQVVDNMIDVAEDGGGEIDRYVEALSLEKKLFVRLVHSGAPSARCICSSTSDTRSPARKRLKSEDAFCLPSGKSAYKSRMGCPINSSREYPSSSAARRLHPCMRPSIPIVK